MKVILKLQEYFAFYRIKYKEMLYELKIEELNKIQKNAMSKELIKEHYEWEDLISGHN